MKTIFFSAFLSVTFAVCSCETEEQRKAKLDAIRTQLIADSIKAVSKELLPFYDCKMKILMAGGTEEQACGHCRKIRPKGFYYDSINTANDKLKSTQIKH